MDRVLEHAAVASPLATPLLTAGTPSLGSPATGATATRLRGAAAQLHRRLRRLLGDWLGRTLGRRFVTVSLGVLLIVQAVSFAVVDTTLRRHTLAAGPKHLAMGTRTLQRMLEWRAQRLLEAGRLLAADYGFREAVHSNDHDTIASVLANHGQRIGASEVVLLDTAFRPIAEAEGQVTRTEAADIAFAVKRVTPRAAASGGASDVVMLAGQPRQLVLVPMKAPKLVAWVAMFFEMQHDLAEEVHLLAASDLTLLARPGSLAPWSVVSSRLDARRAAMLAARPWRIDAEDGEAVPTMTDVEIEQRRIGVRLLALTPPEAPEIGAEVIALISIDLDDALKPPRDLQLALLLTTLLGFLAFGVASAFSARRITTPLHSLATAAERLGGGDLDAPIRSVGGDAEVRELARALEQMRASVLTNQQKVLQSEKLASLGQLSAGVAHEINNPIGFVFSNFGTLEDYLRQLFRMLEAYRAAESAVADPAVADALAALRAEIELDYVSGDIPVLLAESKDGIDRVRKIVQDLKNFSHMDSRQKWETADLEAGLDSTLNIVANEVKYKADVVKDYGRLPPVECLPHELNQVFMNLIVNASHAIGTARGRIVLRTRAVDGEARIEIQDNGSGIAPEDLQRIFDPFFTTKPIGQGTGLGLSLSYGIVKKHGGRIEVESVPGRGTCFRVCVPLRRQA